MIGGVFFELDDDEVISLDEIERPKPIEKFPAKLISIIRNYMPIGLSSLEDSVNAINAQFDSLKREFNSSRDELINLRRFVEDTQLHIRSWKLFLKRLIRS